MGEENKNWYEISKSHLDEIREKNRNERGNQYSHYDSLINDNVISIENNEYQKAYDEDELDAIFREEDSYDKELETDTKTR